MVQLGIKVYGSVTWNNNVGSSFTQKVHYIKGTSSGLATTSSFSATSTFNSLENTDTVETILLSCKT